MYTRSCIAIYDTLAIKNAATYTWLGDIAIICGNTREIPTELYFLCIIFKFIDTSEQ